MRKIKRKKIKKAFDGKERAPKSAKELRNVKENRRGADAQSFNPTKDKVYNFEDEAGLFATNEFIKRIITIPVKDSIGKDPIIKFESKSDQSRFDNYIKLKKIDIRYIIYQLIVETRKHGTAVLFPILKDITSSLELQKGVVTDVEGFNIISEDEIKKIEMNDNFWENSYKKIMKITIGENIKVHPTRCYVSWNDRDIVYEQGAALGISTLNKLSQELTGYSTIKWSIAELAYRLSFLFFKGDESVAKKKAEQEDWMKDINAKTQGFIGKEDDVISINSGAGINPVTWAEAGVIFISAATGIPKTRILGTEAGALASSEENRLQYKDVLEGMRTFEMEEPIRFIVDLISEAISLGVYEIEWPDLFIKSDNEKSEVNKTNAETLKLFVETLDKLRVIKREDDITEIGQNLAGDLGINLEGVDLSTIFAKRNQV